MEFCPHCMRPATGARCTECGGEVNWKAPATQLSVGTLLRGSNNHVYQLGAAKGQGGFGITYAALDLMSNFRVAIKEYYPTRCAVRDHMNTVIPATGQQDTYRGGMASFLEEAKMLSAVGALPSVVSVRDYFEANGTAYIVMEYVDGLPLNEVLAQQGRIPAQQLMPMLKDLLRDLGILHRAGVIHRDISPDNLILTPQGTLKLLDFGSARSVQNGKSMTVMLKAGFSPVEQYQSKGQGPYTDVYALAGTIYYCLTGKIPPTAIDRISEDELVSPNQYGAQLSQEQEEALLWGLTVQPSARPQNIAAFANALLGSAAGPITGTGNHFTDTDTVTETTPADSIPDSVISTAPKTGPRTGPQTGPRTGPQTGPQTGPHTGTNTGRKPGKGLLFGILGGAAVAVIAIVVLLVSLLSGGTTDDGFKYKFKGDDAIIVGYEGSDKSVTIPSIIEDHVVVTIRENAFAGKRMTFVTIPDSVTTVEANAFQNCTLLEIVSVQGRNVEIRKGSFNGCISLRCIITANERVYDRVTDSPEVEDLKNVAVCYIGQQFPAGKVQVVTVEDEVPYALTESGTAIALLIPSDMTEDDLPSTLDGRRVFTLAGKRVGAIVGTTEDGFEYELLDGEAFIVGYTGDETILAIPIDIEGNPVVEVSAGAFTNSGVESLFLNANVQRVQPGAFTGCENLRDVYAYSEVQASGGVFVDCPRLRCLVVKNCTANGWELPQGCVVFSGSEDTGAGYISYVGVDDDGVVYGITDQDEAVLLDVPAGISEITVPDKVYGYPVVWTHPNALNNAAQDITIHMGTDMGFPFALFDRATWLNNSFGDFSHSWVMSCAICADINSRRPSNQPKIYPERSVVLAAMVRAKEMNTSNSHDRPNGQRWSTALDDYEVEWYSGRAFKDTIAVGSDQEFSNAFDAMLTKLADNFLKPNDDGDDFVAFGAAMYHNSSRQTVYVNAMGIIRK